MKINLNYLFYGMVALSVTAWTVSIVYGHTSEDINTNMTALLDECMGNELDDLCQATYNVLDRLCQLEYFKVCWSDKYVLD